MHGRFLRSNPPTYWPNSHSSLTQPFSKGNLVTQYQSNPPVCSFILFFNLLTRLLFTLFMRCSKHGGLQNYITHTGPIELTLQKISPVLTISVIANIYFTLHFYGLNTFLFQNWSFYIVCHLNLKLTPSFYGFTWRGNHFS